MRILITGGAGCLGSNLTERYLIEGHDVCVIDNFETGHRDSLPNQHSNLVMHEGSVTDANLIDKIFADFKPTHVIHSAAAYKDPNDWLTDARVNVEGTINVIRASEKANVKRFINFHTALGYGRPEAVPIPVDAPARPFTSYGISKQSGENFLMMSNLNWTSFRLANVTGPRLAIGPIPTFYMRLKEGKSCFCSKTIRDFIDMEDFFTITDLALEEDAPTGCFNVSTGTGHSIREIFDIVVEHHGITLDEDVSEVEPSDDDVVAVVLDPSQTKSAFNWRPEYSFEQTVKRMLDWYDSNGVVAIFSHLRTPEEK